MAFRIGPEPTPHPRFPKKPGSLPPREKTLFEQLFPVSWRGIAFPVSSMKIQLSQDLVQHKYVGIDGARVEATGRAPLEIDAVIPFVNGIVPGKGEKWGVLYPTTFRDFLKAFADRKTGILVHPELEDITCKPVSLEVTHDAQRRDGVIVNARWLETVDDSLDSVNFFADSPIKAAELAALDLDASKVDLLSLVPDAPWQEETFESLVNKLAGFVDSTTSTIQLLQAKPGQILWRINRLKTSVVRAKNVLTWPVEEGLAKLEEAYNKYKPGTKTVYGTGGVQQTEIPKNKSVSRYVTPSRMTASAIASTLGASIEDLMELNPMLVARPEVAARTVIRYYGN